MKKKVFIIYAVLFLFIGLFLPKIALAAVTVDRISGVDRFETSVAVSKTYWTSAVNVIIASGSDFPDALCATPLAKKLDAPIILTSKDNISDTAIAEIKRLGVKIVTIVGGTAVVSTAVESKISSITYSENGSSKNIVVNRIAGADRYETSIGVAKALGKSSSAFLAFGYNFPDAISAASIAGVQGMPIILTDINELPSVSKSYIASSNFEKVYALGGTGVISKGIVDSIPNSVRISGNTRYETNIAILKAFENTFNFNITFIASGENFPDALTGSAVAAKKLSPVLLVSSNIDAATKTYLEQNKNQMNNFMILGGTGAVDASLISEQIIKSKNKVVIDPGHGGSDSGAVGPTGIYEKTINLAVALKTGAILKSKGIDVVYTRSTDVLPWGNIGESGDLKARVAIANSSNADYFISIHSNSAESLNAYGTETYSYTSNGDGAKLAQMIQSELVKSLSSYDRGVKTANFYVIKNTDMPAALAELGFISNANEEKLLNSSDYQNKAAQAISSGILKMYGY